MSTPPSELYQLNRGVKFKCQKRHEITKKRDLNLMISLLFVSLKLFPHFSLRDNAKSNNCLSEDFYLPLFALFSDLDALVHLWNLKSWRRKFFTFYNWDCNFFLRYRERKISENGNFLSHVRFVSSTNDRSLMAISEKARGENLKIFSLNLLKNLENSSLKFIEFWKVSNFILNFLVVLVFNTFSLVHPLFSSKVVYVPDRHCQSPFATVQLSFLSEKAWKVSNTKVTHEFYVIWNFFIASVAASTLVMACVYEILCLVTLNKKVWNKKSDKKIWGK